MMQLQRNGEITMMKWMEAEEWGGMENKSVLMFPPINFNFILPSLPNADGEVHPKYIGDKLYFFF